MEESLVMILTSYFKIHNNQNTSWCYYVKEGDEIELIQRKTRLFAYFWLFSKQQFWHRSLPHPGPNSSRSSPLSLVKVRSSWSTSFRLFPAVTLDDGMKGASKIIMVFEEFIDNAERRGESPAGDGDGVGDHVRCGVGG